MKILLVNDDGIRSKRLEFAEKVLKDYGVVYVVAPEHQQSGKSTSITIGEFEYRTINEHKYAIKGTPADCVSFALFGVKIDPDLVISGINKGYNIGVDILYSGTVGAAFQANYFQKKTIAFSGDFQDDAIVRRYFKETLDYILNNNLPSEDYIVNVNFPSEDFGKPKGTMLSRQFFRRAQLIAKMEHNVFSHDKSFLDQEIPEDTDVYAHMNGYISISKIRLNNLSWAG